MRGFVIASMLLVNMTWNRDALPGWLFHVPWNDPAQGATFADLVFPWFVFIAGAAAPLSLRSGRGRGKTPGQVLASTARRAALLYLLGVLLTVAGGADTHPLRWESLFSWNILQLLGVAYFFVVAVQFAPITWQVGLVVVTLLAKWATFLIPYDHVASVVTVRPPEGAPTGPGTWAHFDGVKQLLHLEHVAEPSLATHAIGWLGMAQQFLPLAAIGVVGALSTRLIVDHRSWRSSSRVAGAGVALVALGFVLQADYDPAGGGWFGVATVPYSKWLFSPAYCLLSAGTGCLLLAAFFGAFDLARWPGARPFVVMGRNALAIYLGAELSFKLIFGKWLLPTPDGAADTIAGATQAWIEHATASPAAASLGWAALWLAGWWLVAWRMDARGVYWRV